MSWQYGPNPKLSDWQVAELQSRARAIQREWPRMHRLTRAQRWSRMVNLAADYDITVRSLYRYLRRAA